MNLLISTIGTTEYEEAEYALDGESVTSRYSTVAVERWIDDDVQPLVIRTEGAAEMHDEELRGSFETEPGFETIPLGQSEEELQEIFTTIVESIGEAEPDSVSLDITHGFRSLPMVYFASLTYVSTLEDIEVEGVYYGAFEARDGDVTPVFDMTYLFDLMDWYHAVRTFRETGSLLQIQELLEERKTSLFKKGEKPRSLGELTGPLRSTHESIASGLPLESGTAAQSSLDALASLDESSVGPGVPVLEPLEEELERFEVRNSASEKSEIELSIEEMKREAEIIEYYVEKGNLPLALECLRELFINRLLLGSGKDWLDRYKRDRAKRAITSELHDRKDDEEDTPEVVKSWDRIADWRNFYAHAGFKEEGGPNRDRVKDEIRKVTGRIEDDDFWDIEVS
jgi:CRISPR-associated DxTHG motif protein